VRARIFTPTCSARPQRPRRHTPSEPVEDGSPPTPATATRRHAPRGCVYRSTQWSGLVRVQLGHRLRAARRPAVDRDRYRWSGRWHDPRSAVPHEAGHGYPLTDERFDQVPEGGADLTADRRHLHREL